MMVDRSECRKGTANRNWVRSLTMSASVISTRFESTLENEMQASKRKLVRKEYTASDIKLLKAHSRARTPVSKLSKMMKRSEGSLRQKARVLGIGLGHQR